jgi:twinkle protein
MITEQIYAINAQMVYDLDCTNTNGKNSTPCPVCSPSRKKQKAKCLDYNTNLGVGYCNHCEERFVKHKPHENQIEYKIPEWSNKTDLSANAAKWFETKRMISQEVLIKMGVCSKSVYMPQLSGEANCICFPFYKDGKVLNVKYRDGQKNFKLESGAELIWYNYDAIKSHKEIIICEGEIDALSFIADGMANVISVPNGASAKQMAYLDSSIKELEKVETFIIATDGDAKGIELRNELIRRLGEGKCKTAHFKEFKDANEYRVHNGHKSLLEVIKSAKYVKIDGVVNAEDIETDVVNLFNNGLPKGKNISFPVMDELITWETKRLLVATGTPQSGKSEIIDFITTKLNLKHFWKCAYWTPENFPIAYHYSKLNEKISGLSFNKADQTEAMFWNVHNHIKKNFFWVDPDDNLGVDNILSKFEFLVKTKGIKICVIDPFNKLDNSTRDNERQYISKLLDKLILFAKKNDVLMILIAHPTKLRKQDDGTYPMPTMYDISGSADFWNKADYGMALSRAQEADTKKFLNEGICSIQKVKFKHLGKTGAFEWFYNFKNGRYSAKGQGVAVDMDSDNKSWLSTKPMNDDLNADWTPFD